jgi:hypothetical protein
MKIAPNAHELAYASTYEAYSSAYEADRAACDRLTKAQDAVTAARYALAAAITERDLASDAATACLTIRIATFNAWSASITARNTAIEQGLAAE